MNSSIIYTLYSALRNNMHRIVAINNNIGIINTMHYSYAWRRINIGVLKMALLGAPQKFCD